MTPSISGRRQGAAEPGSATGGRTPAPPGTPLRAPDPFFRKQRRRGRGGARGEGLRGAGGARRGAGRRGRLALTALSSRYTSGYWKDSMAGASGGGAGRGLRQRTRAGRPGGGARLGRAAAARAAARGDHSAGARATGPAAGRRRRAESRKQLSPRPGAPPRRAGTEATRGSGRRLARAGPGAQLPLQDGRARPRRPSTRAAALRARRTHARPPSRATAPSTRRGHPRRPGTRRARRPGRRPGTRGRRTRRPGTRRTLPPGPPRWDTSDYAAGATPPPAALPEVLPPPAAARPGSRGLPSGEPRGGAFPGPPGFRARAGRAGAEAAGGLRSAPAALTLDLEGKG